MEVKERILTAAEELFMQYGFRSISMDDIARHISVSKKTIYQFFEDKDEIVNITVRRHFEKEKEVCNHQVFCSASNAVEEMVMVAKLIKLNTLNINPAVIFDLQKYHPKAWQILQDFKQDFMLQSILRNLRSGVAEGLYRNDIDIEVLARLRLEEVQMGFDSSIFSPVQFNPYHTQIQLLEHFIRGIVTAKGLALFNEYKNRE
jgi:TetR/AcrR family transcriptional regulator, cholesterol catabolism regulator